MARDVRTGVEWRGIAGIWVGQPAGSWRAGVSGGRQSPRRLLDAYSNGVVPARGATGIAVGGKVQRLGGRLRIRECHYGAVAPGCDLHSTCCGSDE